MVVAPQALPPIPDASVRADGSAPSKDATLDVAVDTRPAAPVEIDLLHHTPTTVSVSSTLANLQRGPDKLTDGDATTSWNSFPGDRVGASIEVQLPSGARVTGLAMTVGNTSREGVRNLFLQNHRVKRVRVSRDGRDLGEFELDVDDRALQRIPVRGPAGKWRIEIVETERGILRWDEVTISELRVFGHTLEPDPDARPTFLVAGRPFTLLQSFPTTLARALDTLRDLRSRPEGGATADELAEARAQVHAAAVEMATLTCRSDRFEEAVGVFRNAYLDLRRTRGERAAADRVLAELARANVPRTSRAEHDQYEQRREEAEAQRAHAEGLRVQHARVYDESLIAMERVCPNPGAAAREAFNEAR